MGATFLPHSPSQMLLLPPDLGEWLPEGHLAYHVSDIVDALDLRAFYAPDEGNGRRKSPYEPGMMVKILVYAYATGVFSSRRIARRVEEDVAFRVLAAGNFPQHRTVCEFRRRHLANFERLFVDVVRVAGEMGLADAGYCNEADLAALEARGIRGHVALGREGRKHAAIDRDRRPATHRMEEHLATPQGRAAYAERKGLSETPNGWIKEVLGFRRFHVWGQKKVQGEWSLVCLALNIRRMSGLATA